jgi:uncharacterized protein (TIGR02677 family)
MRKRTLPEVDVLWYATQPLTPTYRAIVQVFADAERDTFTLELAEPEVLQALRASPYEAEVDGEASLRVRLDELHQHGNLNRRQDERATSLEDLDRRRFLWSLTPGGKIAHQAIEDVESGLGLSGSLQVTMLVTIRDSLRALIEGDLSANDTYALLDGLFTAQERFTGEAQRYIGRITDRHVLGAGGLDEEEFGLRKEAIKLYLSRFVSQLILLSPEIDELLRTLDGARISALVDHGATADDIPPPDETGDPAAEWRARQHTHWQGLLRWYVRAGTRPPTVDRLRAVALDAVTALTRSLSRLNAARTGAPTRAAAFLQAARWMAEQDAGAAHRLWVALTGLHPARHLSIPEDDPEVTSRSASWWDAVPIDVPVTIRRQNRSNSTGRASKARDTHATRQLLRHRRRREREQARAALARLLTNGPARLSGFSRLDRHEFDLLLDLLSDALSARRVGGVRSAFSGASGVQIVLSDPEPESEPAKLQIVDGTFTGPDYLVDIQIAISGNERVGGGVV